MTDSRRRVGRRGEEMAMRHLSRSGYRILAANYRGPEGEIDLVAEKDGVLVFVEVRARTGRTFGSPEESLTDHKRRSLVQTAQRYLQETECQDRPWRIDLVAVDLDAGGRLRRLKHIESAVEG